MNILLPLQFSLLLAVLFFIIPDVKKFIKILAPLLALANLVMGIIIFINPVIPESVTILSWEVGLLTDKLSMLIFLFIGIFGFLISVYSAGYIEEKLNKYFSYYFLTLASAYGIVLSDNWLLFIVFWGISGVTLYMMMQFNTEANSAAKKTLIILGGSDSLLILGVAMIYKLSESFDIMQTPWALFPFILFGIAAFAKAGNMPFHSWIPDCGDKAPVSVTAFMPASLDKLLGIYLLTRMFGILGITSGVKITIMLLGAVTIIFAVFMALAQHGAKKLLSYHAVSQVGYMVLGIGTGNPLGIAGGLFHMLNNSIYKSILFMGVGQVEKERKTADLDKLGGLAKFMPMTFISMLIASFAISGIPPLNGFFSKWLIYQGVLVSTFEMYPVLSIICLIAALFGSALTLASFMKLMHAIFLGPKQYDKKEVIKEKLSLSVPQLILAAFCIVLGLFATALFIKPFAIPIIGDIEMTGLWNPQISLLLMIAGLILGVIVYIIANAKTRRVSNFIGGNEITREMNITGVDFYSNIQDMFPFKNIYKLAEKKLFDLYNQIKGISLYFIGMLRSLHNGVLNTYLSWIFAGGIIILVVLWLM